MSYVKRYGFTAISSLLLLLIAGFMVMCLVGDTQAIPRSDVRDNLGSFTGPISGTAQDDNVKASLDLAHTDLDSIIVGVNDNYASDGNTIAGQEYATVMTSAMVDDDLFDVDGGAILITSFVGVVDTNSQAQANTIEINLDADTGFTDYDFTTAVETNGDAAGTRYVFSNANESVLTPLEGADAGASILMTPWFCGEGMIELNAAQATHTGAIKWYMTWIPYEDGTTVTAQ